MATRAKTRQRKRKEEKATHDINGMKVKLNPIDPIFIQQVMNSVRIPDVPTYETKIAGGGTQVHELDEAAASESEEDTERWNEYVRRRDEAISAQSGLAMRAVILDGTEAPMDWEAKAHNYFRRMKIIGVKPSSDPEERWVDYVDQTLSDQQKLDLSADLMRVAGVPDEVLADAQDSFRINVPDGSESAGDAAEGSSEEDAIGEVEA